MSQIKLPHDHGEAVGSMWEKIPSTADFQQVAELLRQLSDGSRLRLFWLLCHCEECVINLSAMMEMSSPAISHHLRQLRSSGLIVSRRQGKEVYYKAADSQTARLLHHLAEQLIQISCPHAEDRDTASEERMVQHG